MPGDDLADGVVGGVCEGKSAGETGLVQALEELARPGSVIWAAGRASMRCCAVSRSARPRLPPGTSAALDSTNLEVMPR
jgi:hypothetical protein